MTDVILAGIGQTAVGEHWEISLRSLAARAMLAALKDAGGLKPQALYIGNFLGSILSHQANLGPLLADNAGLGGLEAFTVEAAGASGAAAFRLGYLAVASGFVDTALVVGVEKFTDQVGASTEAAVAQGLDFDFEGVPGLTATGQAALLMQRYLYEYGLPREALCDFALTAHRNGAGNPNAMYRKAVSRETYLKAEMVSDPLNLFDQAPYADGAAAVLLARRDLLPDATGRPLVRVSGSAAAIDTLSLHDRPNPLGFEAARQSVERACRQAGIMPGDADLFELPDSFSIYAALSLEAAGLAPRGQGWRIPGEGKLPMMTMGGMKARGNPLGAAGVYQLVEAALQLRGEAGACQVSGARRALVQCLGGPASTAVTHVLESL